MKIITFSDSHGDFYKLEQVVLQNKTANLFIHLGDGINEFLKLKQIHKSLPIIMVKGNCDFSHKSVSNEKELNIFNTKIFACHGDRFSVKTNLEELTLLAKEKNINLILYGHTHIANLEKKGSTTFLNPGSLSRPRVGASSYGEIIVLENEFFTRIIEL